jgi:hypothetical protein
MGDVLNDRQRRFCELIVGGESATQAYRAAFAHCGSDRAASAGGSRLLKRPVIAAAIAALRAEVTGRAMSELVADKREVLEFLTGVVRAAPGDVDEASGLCQSFKHTPGVREVRLPCKLRAAELLGKMLGLNEPDKVQHEAGDSLAGFLRDLRAGE